MVIKDHWYRPQEDEPESPCGFTGCSKSKTEHLESVGEWQQGEPHLAIPHPMALSFCLRCDRKIGHTLHPLIPKALRTR